MAAGATREETVLVCVGPNAPRDVSITATTGALADGPPLGPEPEPRRRVGVKLGPVVVEPFGQPCGDG